MMGQYGAIEKCIIQNVQYNPKNENGPCNSAFITYSHAKEAAIAILVKI